MLDEGASFHEEISHQDRLGTMIANSVQPITSLLLCLRQRFRSGKRSVDPDFVRKLGWLGSASYEAFRVKLISRIEHGLTFFSHPAGLAVVHHRRREQPHHGVAMFLVVPAKKSLTESTAVLDTAKAVREVRSILQGAKLTFRERIVVRDVRPTLCVFVTPRSASKKATGLDLIEVPRSACSVSWPGWMHCFLQLSSINHLASSSTPAHRDHATGDVAAEDIEKHVEVEVRPLRRTQQLGDVPAPKLIGSRGHEFRLLVGRMSQLIAALARLAALFQQAIHRCESSSDSPFIQQGRIHSGWRAVLKTFFVKTSQDRVTFGETQSTCRCRPRWDLLGRGNLTAIPVVRSARHSQSLASRAGAHVRC